MNITKKNEYLKSFIYKSNQEKMELNKLKNQLQTEVDTSFLYDSIAAIQSDKSLSRVLLSPGKIEKGHSEHLLDKVHKIEPNYKMPLPSGSAKFQLKLSKIFGCSSIISALSAVEKQFAENTVRNKIKVGEKLEKFVEILLNLLINTFSRILTKGIFELTN